MKFSHSKAKLGGWRQLLIGGFQAHADAVGAVPHLQVCVWIQMCSAAGWQLLTSGSPWLHC